eukprot:evm.model.scf_1979.4 EVM.evm.TU.scf_1979.4   scf_1979:24871-28207(-)
MAQNSSANGAESLAVAAASTAGPSVQPAVVLSFAGRLKEYAAGVVRQGKPWSEVVDRTAFSRPQNLAEATSRLKKNVAYFRINYLIIVIMAITVCMLMNPGSLMVLCTLLVAWIYVFVIRTTPLVIANQPLSDEMKLMGMAVISFIVIFFLTRCRPYIHAQSVHLTMGCWRWTPSDFGCVCNVLLPVFPRKKAVQLVQIR